MLKENLASLKHQIRLTCQSLRRDPESVLLVAVSKKQPLSKLKEMGFHHQHFAENHVQDLLERQKYFPDLKWHFIGRIQSNKLKFLIGKTYLIHSMNQLKYLKLADKLAHDQNVVQDVLLQVHLSDEISKQGFLTKDLPEAFCFLKTSRHLKCKGLMTLPPFTKDASLSRIYFQKLRALQEYLKKTYDFLGSHFRELSMGTSQDFLVAIEEGATMVRVGEKLFGPRPSK